MGKSEKLSISDVFRLDEITEQTKNKSWYFWYTVQYKTAYKALRRWHWTSTHPKPTKPAIHFGLSDAVVPLISS